MKVLGQTAERDVHEQGLDEGEGEDEVLRRRVWCFVVLRNVVAQGGIAAGLIALDQKSKRLGRVHDQHSAVVKAGNREFMHEGKGRRFL